MVPFNPNRRKIDDVIDALRAAVLLNSTAEAPCWTNSTTEPRPNEMISMTNGLLHVPTRTLLPHTPYYFCHHALAFPFLAECAAPAHWLKFLRELWDDDESSIHALQEVMGYILGGDTRQQKIFLFVGPKRGGKGTIGRVLTGLLGAHNVAAPTLAAFSTNFGLSPLIGKPLGLVSDARLSGKSDSKVIVERLLSVSGEDSLTIDRKYKEPWTGRLPTRFVVLTNELPRLTDSSGALASRFVVFVLRNSFYGKENTGLTDELLIEAPAIFNWALEGLDRLNARGYFDSPSSGKEAVQQLEDLSSPISAFIRDTCVVGHNRVEAETLWVAWKTWCDGEGRHPGTKAVFGRDLKAAVPTVERVRSRHDDARSYVYEGIQLRDSSQTHTGRLLGPRQCTPGRRSPIMQATTPAPELVTLRGGLVVPATALRVLWDLEDRGFDIKPGDRRPYRVLVGPAGRLTAEDKMAIHTHRDALAELVRHMDEVVT